MLAIGVLIENILIGAVLGKSGQPYASMKWREHPWVSAIISIVILGVQALSFHLAKTHVEYKKKWESWKHDFEVQMLTSGDQDMNV